MGRMVEFVKERRMLKRKDDIARGLWRKKVMIKAMEIWEGYAREVRTGEN